ncbi:hypothetical protein LY28_01099 [Ruminiclostridium sufflavum DSM 19573]|uniref:3-oxoacyl-[acyl-carrier protein] reductase n=1 Tax=Ruminiclostridium sufflavum DSM 19573 TaxID=1121337 RepID=A0A318XNZ4_9FIRM|nr:glucose 1-dehydrogenase [Ruminiclostridium sufflavum]PYG88745.1 hypothetical protein LY28_01099 [Ruminiclostridium sufflavum DSM 19573]
MGKLKGKIAFITGGAAGNGRGIAESFLRQGAEVILADISDTVFTTADELGENVFAYQLDITKPHDVNNCVADAAAKLGRIDILVNNAGIARFSKFIDIEDKLRDLQFDVNIKGTWNCTKAILPHMINNKYGRIINMSSVTGPYAADPGEVAYATTKAAIIGFTKALAIETAQHNITVNAICPGYILTSMVRHSAGESNPVNPQAVIDAIAAGIPMKRLGTPGNIGDLAAFLASGEADYITGTDIIIDGGNGIPETNSMGLR